MNRFSAQFTNRHVILPVIHVENGQQAAQNAQIAYEAGTDGVFLINHEAYGERPLDYRRLLAIYEELTAVYSDWWIGVNCLDLTAQATFAAIGNRVAGVWVDNAHIDETQTTQPIAEQIRATQQQANWRGLYFGGVAFKYQRPVSDVIAAAQQAMAYMDVVTTSGSGTGETADLAKIQQMKVAIGDFPLAIASGITPENVASYLPFADCFLVATGISRSFYHFDPVRVQALVAQVR